MQRFPLQIYALHPLACYGVRAFLRCSTLSSSGLRYGLSNVRGTGSSADVHDAPPPTQSAPPADLDTAHGVASVIPAVFFAAVCRWLSRAEEA